MNERLVTIARIIVCPGYANWLQGLRGEDRAHPHMVWQRPCRDCGAIMAVPPDVMEEVENDPSIRLACDECVPLHDCTDEHDEPPSTQ